MPHINHLEWHLEGDQEFLVRFGRDDIPSGIIIDTIDQIVLQKRTGVRPEVWESTGVTPNSQAIVTNDADPNDILPNAAIYWTAVSDTDGDPVPGAKYRWLVVATKTDALQIVAKVPVELVP